MSQLERQQKILAMLRQRPSVTVREISQTLFFSEASVRRDIRALSERGLVTHLYGAVTLTRHLHSVVPIDLRDDDHSAQKDAIARKAAALVRDGDTLLVDSSSTVRRMMRHLSEKRELRIFTNNLKIFEEPCPPGAELYAIGGRFSRENHNFGGPAAEEALRGIRADLFFFSSQGLSTDGEINDISEGETALRRVMLTRARRRVFLCDSSKIGVSRPFVLCPLSMVEEVVCEREADEETIRSFRRGEIKEIYPANG